MKRAFIFISLFFLFQSAFGAGGQDSLFAQLNSLLDKKKTFDDAKLKRIDQLRQQLVDAGTDLKARYQIYSDLYEEYKSFNYNQAFQFAQKVQQTAYQLRDPEKIDESRIRFGFIYLSSGMFKEVFDSLRAVNVKGLDSTAKKSYYFLLGRTYYDLSDYDKEDYYTSIYDGRASRYIDSATALCKPSSWEFIYYNGLKFLKTGNIPRAITELKGLMTNHHLPAHEFAITASTLSDIYIRQSQPDSAISLLIRAAMADIESSTKETAAMTTLAQLLDKNGDVQNAYVYIKQALEDATYYGARQRKIQVSAILPLIAAERINSVEGQRRVLFFYASSLTVLAIIVVVFAIIIYKQLQKLKAADKIILQTNHDLQESINKLDEANKIKEEYIGYYFNLISEYIEKLDRFKRSVDNKLTTKRFEDIRIVVNNINLGKEREELFVNFDKAFLKIFPNFVSAYNALFSAENHVKLLPNQLLNTDLRIFALVRLGISDTEKIAHILDYSVNTIYNYKARIKAKSLISNEGFEDAIMAIRAI